MTDDRELLELAAKAAGIEIDGVYESGPDAGRAVLINGTWWSPLHDDGDALRLAVKLGLDVCIDTVHEDEPYTHVIGFHDPISAETLDAIEAHGDPYAATRRAIVRAAAEIGRNM